MVARPCSELNHACSIVLKYVQYRVTTNRISRVTGEQPIERGSVTCHYVTYFDNHFLSRGLALYRSMEQHCRPFVLWVLCLDELTWSALSKLGLEHVRLITLTELELADPELQSAKGNRSAVEYYWTCGPAILQYLVSRHSEISMITYLDADLFFFHSPVPIYEELGTNSILIIEHRHHFRESGDQRKYHRFNVGLLVFRRSPTGLACLARWRQQCLAWCYDRQEGDQYGDQGYLTEWPDLYPDTVVLQHRGGGVAPWNLLNHPVSRRHGNVFIGTQPLIFYHFSGLRRIRSWLYEMHAWRFHRRPLNSQLRRWVYGVYVQDLNKAERLLCQAGVVSAPQTTETRSPEWRAARRSLRNPHGVKSHFWVRYRRFMLVLARWTF